MQNVLSQGQHDQRDIEELIAALQNEDDGIRATAAQELGELGNCQAVDPLLAALNDPYSSLVRYQAAQALGKLGDIRAVEPLIASLNHLDINTQVEAARALGNLGDSRAIEALSARMRSGSERLFKASAEALEKLGASKMVKAEQTVRAKRVESVDMMKRAGVLIICTIYIIGAIFRVLDRLVMPGDASEIVSDLLILSSDCLVLIGALLIVIGFVRWVWLNRLSENGR